MRLLENWQTAIRFCMAKRDVISTTQFAKATGLPYTTVVRWAQEGVIPGVAREETMRGPVWVIPQKALDTFNEWRPKRGRPLKPVVEKVSKKGKAK